VELASQDLAVCTNIRGEGYAAVPNRILHFLLMYLNERINKHIDKSNGVKIEFS